MTNRAYLFQSQLMKSWLPTLSLSFASFIFVTSEFIPVGLITEIGSSFGKTDAETGILMTIYAWVVALLSLPLTAYSARFNRRPLMLTLLALFSIAHVFSVMAPTFATLTISRLFVASAHAIFWAIAVPLGIRLAPSGGRERAISLVATGATLGGVLGIPLGTIFGQAFGWKMTFAGIGVCSTIVGLILYRLLPSTPSQNAGDFRSIIPLMKRKDLVLVYLMTAIIMTGHYSAYTFIRPFLQEIGLMKKELTASVFLIFGCSGFLTSFFAPIVLKRFFQKTAIISIAIVAICLILLRGAVSEYYLTALVVLIWGCAFMLFNLVLQNMVLAIAPDAEDVAMAGFSGIYNIGIGGGALIGSLAATNNLFAIGYIGSIFVALATLICLYLIRGRFSANVIIKNNSAH